MAFLDRLGRRLGMALTYVAMCLMLVMAFHVGGSVISRQFFRGDLPMTLELTAYYYMIGMTFMPLVLVDVENAHIRADFLNEALPQRFWQLLDVPIMVAMFAYLTFVAWRTGVGAYERMMTREVIYTAAGDIPIWPSRWVLAISLGLAAAYSLVQAARAFLVAIGRIEPAGEQ